MKIIIRIAVYFAVGLLFTVIIVCLLNPSLFHLIIGDWGKKFGYYEFAIDHYSSSIHLNAKRAGAFNSRGVARYCQGQFEHAVQDYNRAIELNPQYAFAIKNRALAFLAIGNAEDAKQGYTLACNLGQCEDFTRRCPELKLRCEKIECISIQTAIKAGLCQ